MIAILGGILLALATPAADRPLAERLRAAAIDQLAMLNDDSALVLYRAARDADPGWLAPNYEYMLLMIYRFRGPELRREYETTDSSSALKQCLMVATTPWSDPKVPVARAQAIEDRFGPSPCTDAIVLGIGIAKFDSVRMARATRVSRESPVLSEIWGAVARAWRAQGQPLKAEQVLIDAIEATDNVFVVVGQSLSLVNWRVERGDSAGATAAWKALGERVRRDGRPGPLAEYHGAFCNGQVNVPRATDAARAESCRQLFAIVRPRHAWFTEWNLSRLLSKGPLERGDLRGALPILNRSIALAESLGTDGVKLDSYTQRGRAYMKAGQLEPAARDLRRAIAVGPGSELPHYYAEAWHNLAHTYEGAGRWAEAATAADSFAAIAATMPRSSLRWSSKHDAGTIRWAAGWHEAASRDFEEMVRIIDELNDDGWAFAGEYFERRGDLGRALRYYREGARGPTPDVRNLAALARIYEALGMLDSAEAAARAHDADPARWSILEKPVLPDVLTRRGRWREALAIVEAWARRQISTGNVEGAAIAQLQLADLQLRNRDPAAARIAALKGDSLSRILRLTAQTIQARILIGRALVDEGKRVEGLGVLRGATALAAAHPTVENLRASNLALGGALEASGSQADALVAYDRAASAVERMTAGLSEDAQRSGFKELHLAPFDGALRILTSGGESLANAESALAWTVRRKAAALRLAGDRAGSVAQSLSVPALRRRIPTNEALVDFTVQDSSVSAIVVRDRTASVIPLGVAPTQLTDWVELLRRPFVSTPGGRIDLAHLPFDAVVAESLYRALIAPIVPMLGGVRRLAIVPDGPLWHVPFAALVTGRDGSGSAARTTFLVERFELRLLPSVAHFAATEGSALPAGFRVDAFTYDVPGGNEELSAIRSAVGAARVTTRTGAASTEREVLRASSNVLHLSVHGVVNDLDPLASHLRVAPAAPDDGLLHLSEVAGHHSAPKLVVLTSCEAVNGKLYAGEGLAGLARAFVLGGARQVIASDWPVVASASAMSAALYRELARGQTPAAALRSAQLALLGDPRTAHPINWAGFVLFDAGPPVAPRRQTAGTR